MSNNTETLNLGDRVQEAPNKYSNRHGEVVEVGTGEEAGRYRIKWDGDKRTWMRRSAIIREIKPRDVSGAPKTTPTPAAEGLPEDLKKRVQDLLATIVPLQHKIAELYMHTAQYNERTYKTGREPGAEASKRKENYMFSAMNSEAETISWLRKSIE